MSDNLCPFVYALPNILSLIFCFVSSVNFLPFSFSDILFFTSSLNLVPLLPLAVFSIASFVLLIPRFPSPPVDKFAKMPLSIILLYKLINSISFLHASSHVILSKSISIS